MDTGQHNLLAAAPGEHAHFIQHIVHCPAPHPSTGKRNNTVCAELIAAILYLDIRPCACFRAANLEILIFFCMIDVNLVRECLCILFFPAVLLILSEHGEQLSFPVIAEHDVNRRILLGRAVRRLHVAAGRHDNCIRIHLACPVQHLSGFAVGDIRHRARIDHIDICPRLKWHNLIPCFLQQLPHGLCLICIYFTAQVMQGSLFSHFSASVRQIHE